MEEIANANEQQHSHNLDVRQRDGGAQVLVGDLVATEERRPDVTVSVQSMGRQAVHRVVQKLDRAAADGSPLVGLNFEPHGGDQKWGAVLSVILSNRFADLPLRVSFPDRPIDQLNLARTGILFALARHNDLVVSSKFRDQRLLEAWRRDWTPADYQQPLFDFPGVADTASAPAAVGKDLVAFLNPDRVPPIDRRIDTEAVMFPWLTALMKQRQSSETRDTREWRKYVCRKTSYATYELLQNVREHARLPERGLCSLTAFVDSHRTKLHLSAIDSGQGVLARLEEQHPGLNGREALQRALVGDLPNRAEGRGYALTNIIELVQELGSKSQLFLASGGERTGSVVLDHAGGSDVAPIPTVANDLQIRGTVVTLTIPLEEPPAGLQSHSK